MLGNAALTLEEIAAETSKDNELQRVIRSLSDGSWADDLKPYKVLEDELRESGRILFRSTRPVIPLSLREKVIGIAHLGHPGVASMKRLLRRQVWWHQMDIETEAFYKSCRGCSLVAKVGAPEPLFRTKLPAHPWEFIALDFYEPQEIKQQDFIILVTKDYYTRYVCCTPVRSNHAEHVIAALEPIFQFFGYPERVRTDNGSPFQSVRFSEWCVAKGINVEHTTRYAAQENGLVERMMQSLTRSLRVGKYYGIHWRKLLATLTFAYNHRPHSITGETPANAMFKRRVRGLFPEIQTDDIMQDEEYGITTDCERRGVKKQQILRDVQSILNWMLAILF